MLNDVSGGKSWLEHGVKFEQILKRNAKTKEGSQVLWEYALKHIFQPNIDKGNIMVNSNMETNIPGLYAAGDCTGGLLQIAKAVYEGAQASIAAGKYVRRKLSSKN